MAGWAVLADLPIAGPMFWLRWCCQPFAYRRETRISPTQICVHTNFAVRAETWEQADCECGDYVFLTGVAQNKIKSNKILTGFRVQLLRRVRYKYWLKPDKCNFTSIARNKIKSNKILTGFRSPLYCWVPEGYLKPPMPMDTNLHACGREANFVTMPRLKQRLPSDEFRPKGLRSHQFWRMASAAVGHLHDYSSHYYERAHPNCNCSYAVGPQMTLRAYVT